jgi:hypothetical protein
MKLAIKASKIIRGSIFLAIPMFSMLFFSNYIQVNDGMLAVRRVVMIVQDRIIFFAIIFLAAVVIVSVMKGWIMWGDSH